MWGRAVVAHQAHNLRVIGSNPIPATAEKGLIVGREQVSNPERSTVKSQNQLESGIEADELYCSQQVFRERLNSSAQLFSSPPTRV